MEFRRVGPERGDCTAPYSVTKYKATTVKEFIDEVIKEYPEEWGYFSINSDIVLNENTCEYRYGSLLSDFPDKSVLDKKIEYVDSSGGWSRMDYIIHVS